ncbi:MAG TPA: 6-phosphogluconolactonase [Candidatus Agrococcus pullicola]|uniref:6-phosphogluconolactonase n=1 Tax=Candidatus Agrococcus pullicola TaxID=2838429 RepID=A0A9D1YUJ6_9MICO|nr:6-phosphogluconolactonase [Candidatus Agrococcus pullicola]
MTAKLNTFSTREALIDRVADRAVRLLGRLTEERERVDVCLTGGSVGIGVLAAAAEHPALRDIELERIHWWWGDDRFVPSSSDERNELQAREALLDALSIPPQLVHELPASDAGFSLGEAAVAATNELAEAEPFALTFLGVGPDAHVASLFPDQPGTRVHECGVIAVVDSPKPPPERLSLTFAALNASERIWLVVAGEDKADAVRAALGDFDPVAAPVSGVAGTQETLLFTDASAASLIER